jgi:hypothetical protein
MERSLESLDGSLKQVTGQLFNMSNMMFESAKATHASSQSHKEHKENSESFRHVLFETIEIAKEAGEAFHALGEKVFEMGKEMIDAAGFSERVELAMGTIMGSTREAREEMERFEGLAPKLGMTGRELTGLGAQFLTHGFKAEELPQAIGATSDIEAMNPNNPGAGGEFAGLLQNLKERGVMNERALIGVSHMGVSIPDVMASLAQQYGVKTSAVKKLIEAGKVDEQHGREAIFAAIQKKTKGPLGALGEKAGATVPGRLHALGGVTESIFAGLNNSEGYKTFSSFLGNLVELTGPDSDFGKRMRTGVGEVFNQVMGSLFGDLSGESGAKRLEHVLDGVLSVVKQIPRYIEMGKIAFQEFWPVIKLAGEMFVFFKATALATAAVESVIGIIEGLSTATWGLTAAFEANPIGIIVGGIMLLGLAAYEVYEHWDGIKTFFVGWWNDIKEFFSIAATEMSQMGRNLVDGFLSGVKSQWQDIKDGYRDIWNGAVNTAKEVFDTHSPSKVFAGIGRNTAEGFIQGIDGMGNRIDDTMRDSFDYTGGNLGGATTSSAGGARVISIGDIYVTVEGSGRDADSLGETIGERVREELAGIAEQYALEMGAA